jgi:hypothetical protein
VNPHALETALCTCSRAERERYEKLGERAT